MKNIKIMLMSMLVLAAVGGALAFKAKKFSTPYCSSVGALVLHGKTDASNCVHLFQTSTTDTRNGNLIYFTPTILNQCVFPAGAKCTAYYTTQE